MDVVKNYKIMFFLRNSLYIIGNKIIYYLVKGFYDQTLWFKPY